MITRNQLAFCAAECERQQSGEMSVLHMAGAYAFALRVLQTLSYNDLVEEIVIMGKLIEPTKNSGGFRKVPVILPSGVIPVSDFNRQLDLLWQNSDHLTPAEFYQEFERIHPFVDGNGRVGAILYNWLKGTLDNPVVPPEFKR